ncbi:DeoR/GlpR family DNA-binding transcription regulator [Diaminobutyricibacter sp. McL0618]|uniref:DeoR/GlpR family DNA-binding transcription regulator n=1 Tax=Leifsonia sp. McL0618 TaxID=3415677 RepID=UPI003CEF6FF3
MSDRFTIHSLKGWVMVAAAAQSVIAGVTSGRRAQRMVAILDLVSERGSVSLAELAETLDISAATARRDLSDLADQNLVVRTHGGVTALERGREIPVALRDTRFQEAKRAIAKAMVQRLPPEKHVIALSGGTTTASVARALANHRDIAVVTNSLTIAGLLSGYSGVRVVMTGGFLRPQSLELVGALAESTFNAVNVGTAILGADGISASTGVTTHDETEARTNLAMVTKAQRTVVVADGSKVGAVALAQVADIGQVEMLITDSTADPAELDRLRAAGVEVVVVDVGK